MARFKPLSVKSLPRVMVAILAMDPDDVAMIRDAMLDDAEFVSFLASRLPYMKDPSNAGSVERVAPLFHDILQMSKEDRNEVAMTLAHILNRLRQQDAFGTEGQLDPRGDDR